MSNANHNRILPFDRTRPRVSQMRLRHLADLAPAIVERHRGIHPSVEALVEPVITSAAAFRAVYDAARTEPAHAARRLDALDAAVEPLRRSVQAWLGPLQAAVPTIRVRAFSDARRTAQGTLSDARRILQLVQRHEANGGELPFAADLVADLEARLAAAEQEDAEVSDRTAAHAELWARARAAATELHRALVALRRSLRAMVGRTHPDYRALLDRSGRRNDAEDTSDTADPADTPAP